MLYILTPITLFKPSSQYASTNGSMSLAPSLLEHLPYHGTLSPGTSPAPFFPSTNTTRTPKLSFTKYSTMPFQTITPNTNMPPSITTTIPHPKQTFLPALYAILLTIPSPTCSLNAHFLHSSIFAKSYPPTSSAMYNPFTPITPLSLQQNALANSSYTTSPNITLIIATYSASSL